MARGWPVGTLLILYGLLHLFGFLTSWNLIDMPGISRTPTVLPEDVPVGVTRDLGALWLLGMAAFGVAGYGAIRTWRWWKGLAFASAIVSLVVTILWIHEVWPATILNVLIIVLIARTWRRAEPNSRNMRPSPTSDI